MQSLKLRFVLTLLMSVTVLGLLPVTAASQGVGVVVEGNPIGTNNIGPLNPLLCNDPYCRRITDFLFPTLYAVDPQTGLLIGAASDNYGLAADTTPPTTNTVTIQLRDDLSWSDGTSITAYDVFYSYLAINSRYINTPYAEIRAALKAARVVDAHRIEFALATVNCSTLAHINFPIVPAHVFGPHFQEIVDNTPPADNLEQWFKVWLKTYPPSHFEQMNAHLFNSAPTVSAGIFRFAERLPGEEIRLLTADGALAFVYRDVQFGMDETQFFRSGHSNLLVNPPIEMRDDLLANPELNVTQMSGNTWNYIAMNMANPDLPRSAVDGNGKLLDQGRHPIFGDIRIRQAIQKAININRIIDASVLGYGMPLLSSRIPGTWAANDTLPALGYDPEAAQQLLSDAGWIDHNADGVRECDGCQYAVQDQMLSFSLMVASGDGRELAADLIASQLSHFGIAAYVNVMDRPSLMDQLRFQQFDAYMDGQIQNFPTDADQTAIFTRSGDVLYEGANYGSYANPEIEKLMSQSLMLTGCDLNARAAIYRNIQAILQEDHPYIWLYASKDMLVTHDIVATAPYPNRPFWNIRDWIVTS